MNHEPGMGRRFDRDRIDRDRADLSADLRLASQEDVSNRLWVIALHSAAARRWLEQVPPRVDEAAGTLMVIEEASRQIGLDLPFADGRNAPETGTGVIVYRACA